MSLEALVERGEFIGGAKGRGRTVVGWLVGGWLDWLVDWMGCVSRLFPAPRVSVDGLEQPVNKGALVVVAAAATVAVVVVVFEPLGRLVVGQ